MPESGQRKLRKYPYICLGSQAMDDGSIFYPDPVDTSNDENYDFTMHSKNNERGKKEENSSQNASTDEVPNFLNAMFSKVLRMYIAYKYNSLPAAISCSTLLTRPALNQSIP